MDNENINLLLTEKLNNYFSNEDMSNLGLTNEIAESLLYNVKCNLSMLFDALDNFSELKQDRNSSIYGYTGDIVDVSQDSDVKVKGFITENHKRLHFFKNGEHLPFFKLKLTNGGEVKKLILETTNDSRLFANHNMNSKASKSFNKNLFVSQIEYLFDHRGALRSSSSFVKKSNSNIDEPEIDLNYLDTKYVKFYKIMKEIQQKNGGHFPTSLTTTDGNIFFENIYEIIDSAMEYENEFNLSDIFEIVNIFINSKYTNVTSVKETQNLKSSVGSIVNNSQILTKNLRGENLKIETRNDNGVQFNISINRENGDGTVDGVCKYLIWKTGDGFTVYRKISDNNYLQGREAYGSYIISVSKDNFKFSLIEESSKRHMLGRIDQNSGLSISNKKPLEITMNFSKEGYIYNFDSLEYLESQPISNNKAGSKADEGSELDEENQTLAK